MGILAPSEIGVGVDGKVVLFLTNSVNLNSLSLSLSLSLNCRRDGNPGTEKTSYRVVPRRVLRLCSTHPEGRSIFGERKAAASSAQRILFWRLTLIFHPPFATLPVFREASKCVRVCLCL